MDFNKEAVMSATINGTNAAARHREKQSVQLMAG